MGRRRHRKAMARPDAATAPGYPRNTSPATGTLPEKRLQSPPSHRPFSTISQEKKPKRARSSGSLPEPASKQTSAAPDLTFPFYFPSRDSAVTAQRAFLWLVEPLTVTDFFATYFEKKPHLFRPAPDSSARFTTLLSVDHIRLMLAHPSSAEDCKTRLSYGTDIDVTSYTVDTGRSTLNKEIGSPAGPEAWDMFKNGCSLRLLRPQQHVTALWAICSLLETFFGSVVGANVYLTPPDSQGFAPHFDDIDAFVCQVSGRKRWRVYAPRKDGLDALPRVSSVDFTAEEVDQMESVIDTVLEPGDLLYLPRGAIHQAECPAPEAADGNTSTGPSLHVTISTCQKTTWADLLSATLETAVQSAARECVELRRTLPLRYTDYVGVGCADVDPIRREKFDGAITKALRLLAKRYPIDAAADIMAERFMRERLPPWDAMQTSGADAVEDASCIGPGTRIRSRGRGIARVVMDKDGALPRVIHCMSNSRGPAGMVNGTTNGEAGEFSCTAEEGFAIDAVLRAYPSSLKVRNIALDDAEDRKDLAAILIEMGVANVDNS